MKLKIIMLRKRSRKKRGTYCMILYKVSENANESIAMESG